MTQKIAVIGAGYVGLVSAACFAKFGHDAVCIDNNPEKLLKLESGIMPIYEPGLDVLVSEGRATGKLKFSGDLAASVKNADIILLAVGTPTDAQNGRVDLSYIYAAVKQIAPHLKNGCVVITKSTVPVGTTRQIYTRIRDVNPAVQITVASNPEFLREGQAIGDFMNPDRVVIGADDAATHERVKKLYQPLIDRGVPMVCVSVESSEMIKYAANAFLATKVSFINEIADLAESCGADVGDIARGIGLDKRIGDRFLNPGPGYGGSCFPKDTLAITQIADDHGVDLQIVSSVIASNERRKKNMAQKIIAAMNGDVHGRGIAILGLAFKAETDDMRDAPSIAILTELRRAGANIRAYDPKAMAAAKSVMPFIEFYADAYAALDGADAAVIMTEWAEFANLDWARVKSVLANPLIVDLRNIVSRETISGHGFHYVSIGRPDAEPNATPTKKAASHT